VRFEKKYSKQLATNGELELDMSEIGLMKISKTIPVKLSADFFVLIDEITRALGVTKSQFIRDAVDKVLLNSHSLKTEAIRKTSKEMDRKPHRTITVRIEIPKARQLAELAESLGLPINDLLCYAIYTMLGD